VNGARRRHQKGYIFRKDNYWYLRYYDYEVREDVSKLVWKCHSLVRYGGEYRSKKAVRGLADEFLAPINNGTFTVEGTMSIVTFWDERYLPYITDQKRPSTVNGYTKMWNRYLKDRLDRPIREFRTVDCEQLLQALAHELQVSITTLKHVKHLMSGIFRYGIRTGVLNGVNPVQAACIPKAKPGNETRAYGLKQILDMLEVLPQPSKGVIAVAAFAGLRKGELRSLRPEDYDGSSLKILRAAWRKHVDSPKGKRGVGVVPLIPTAAAVLDEHLASVKPKKYIFETFRGDPADLDYVVREVIRPKLAAAGLPWYGLHAFRRGLATNLHELGVADIVIQAILRHSDVSVARQAYIKNDAVDPRSLAAMEMLETAICNQHATSANAENGKGAVN
jgi:integrase